MLPYAVPKSGNKFKVLLTIIFVVCFGMSIVAYSIWVRDQELLKKHGQPSFNTLPQDELEEGLIVKGTIDIALGTYAEEYETRSGDSEMLYYVLPIYSTDEKDNKNIKYFITYRAEPEEYDVMDAIVQHTWNENSETSSPVKFDIANAQVKSLPGDIRQFLMEWARDPKFYEGGSFIDWCAKNGIFGTDDNALIESKLVPFMIYSTDSAGSDPIIVTVLYGIAMLCLIILMIMTFSKRT